MIRCPECGAPNSIVRGVAKNESEPFDNGRRVVTVYYSNHVIDACLSCQEWFYPAASVRIRSADQVAQALRGEPRRT